MGGIFACVGSCLGACASSAICKVCSSCAPKTNNTSYPYAFLTLMAAIIAIILQEFGHRKSSGFKLCNGWIGGTSENCEFNASPFRILSSLSWFYVIHIIMVRLWGSFQKSFWLMKLLIYTIFVIAMYWVPNHVFEGYAHFGIVAASIFIVLQIVIFINMCYDWNETWVSREWFKGTIAVTFFMYAIAGLLYALSFTYYGKDGCIGNQANLSLSIIASFFLTILSIYAPHGAILPAAGVTLYLSWILFSGLSYVEDAKCHSGMKPNKYTTIFSLGFMCVSIGYFCLSNYGHGVDQDENENGDELERTDSISAKDGDEEASVDVERAEEHKADTDDVTNIKMTKDDLDADEKSEASGCCVPTNEIQAKNMHFHVLMFFGVLYIMTVMCRWETDATGSAPNDGRSDNIVLANELSHWGVVVLYLVTLVAPMICPERFVYDDFESD